jgi:hypothetical protein
MSDLSSVWGLAYGVGAGLCGALVLAALAYVVWLIMRGKP